jgi:MSHA biogenesis protein MshP
MNSNLIRKNRGFTIVSAIFLLVIMAVLGAAIVTVSTSTSIKAAEDYQGSSAYHAARAGAEWGVYKVMAPSTLSTTDPSSPGCTGFGALPATVNGFSVSVSCVVYPAAAPNYYTEADRRISVFEITSTASSGTAGQLDYIERVVKVTVSRCRNGTSGAACG